jgi:transposase
MKLYGAIDLHSTNNVTVVINEHDLVVYQKRLPNLLSIQSLISRTTGNSISAKYIKALHIQRVDGVLPNPDLVLALKANLAVMNSADAQIEILEKAVQERVKLRPQFKFLKTVPGIGPILALTIMLETGQIERFASVGNYASYCRCVGSQKISNGKRKGSGNTNNGNKYLAWAFVEAANFAIRFNSSIKSFYQKKKSKSHKIVAIKAVAHKLCRACYYIMKDQVPFDITKAFA